MVNPWKYVKIVQHNVENEKSALSYFSQKVEIGHFNIQATIRRSIYSSYSIPEY
jgi:hypothetical protein